MPGRKGLGVEDIEASGLHVPAFQRTCQRVQVEHLAAANVDDDGALRKGGQLGRTDHIARLVGQCGGQDQHLATA